MDRRSLFAATLVALATAPDAGAKKRRTQAPLVFVQFAIGGTVNRASGNRPTVEVQGSLTYTRRGGRQDGYLGASFLVPADLPAAKFRDRLKAKVAASIAGDLNLPASRVDVVLI